jgi:hypothetical protein
MKGCINMKRITFNVTDEQAAVLKDNHRLYGITQSEQTRRGLAFIFDAARHARDLAQAEERQKA